MPYSISNIQVSNGDKVVSIDWTYNNGKGQRGNNWKLQQPYGDIPLDSCTEQVLIGWLEAQFPENTTADLDRIIDEDIARRDLEASIDNYTVGNSAPTRVAEPNTGDVVDIAD